MLEVNQVLAIACIMLTWLWGRERLYEKIIAASLPIPDLLKELQKGKIHRVSGTAIYMSGKGKHATFFERLRLARFGGRALNASPASAYFQLPPGRVVELGAQITV